MNNAQNKFVLRDSEAGNEIGTFATEEEANQALLNAVEEDRANGEYEEGFYEVVQS